MNDNPKIFLCDFSSPEYITVAHELKNRGARILYWTGAKVLFENESRDRENWPNTIFHRTFDAVQAIPALGMDTREFSPPDAALIRDMLECESIVLTMMTRMDFGNMPLLKKKRLYYKYVSYWDGVLKKNQPDAVIFSEIPHAVYNFVLYSLAQRYGIKTIMSATSNIWGLVNLVSDYKKNDVRLLAEYKRIEHSPLNVNELNPALRQYFLKLRSGYDATPIFNVEQTKRLKNTSLILPDFSKIAQYWRSRELGKRMRWHLRSLFFIDKESLNIDSLDTKRHGNLWQLRKLKRIKRELNEEYQNVQSDPDLKKKFVYLPLHFQPERSTNPMADHYADQILLAQTVACALPRGWLLYIKEYPLQLSFYSSRSHLARYKGYYQELSKIPNAHVIPMGISTYALIKASQAVVTATGTAGMEALVMGKPVLVFGYPWYMYCDGVFRVDGVAACCSALMAIEDGFKPDPDKVLNYFIALQRTAIHTNQKSRYSLRKDVSFEESVKDITDAFWAAF